MQIHDLKNNLGGDVSLAKGQNVAATLTGDYVDCSSLLGPIQGLCNTGVAAGSPTSFTATYTLMEADDSSGTNAQAVAQQSDALVLTADKDFGVLRGQRTKSHVAIKCVLAFSGGSTPKQDVFGIVLGQKERY